MTPKRLRVHRTYRNVQTNIRKYEADILKLMAHPDATMDQIMEIKADYVKLVETVREIEQHLVAAGYRP